MLRGGVTGLFLGFFTGWCLVDAWIWVDERRDTPSDLSKASTKRLHRLIIGGCGLAGLVVGCVYLGWKHGYR